MTPHETPLPSAEATRQLDGPALTHLAWQWGLAPDTVYEVLTPYHAPMLAYPEWVPFVGMLGQGRNKIVRPWAPHSDLDTAHAVFRQLRTQGWMTYIEWYSPDAGGCCKVFRQHDHAFLFVRWGGREPDTEPLALLRCAVLAMVS